MTRVGGGYRFFSYLQPGVPKELEGTGSSPSFNPEDQRSWRVQVLLLTFNPGVWRSRRVQVLLLPVTQESGGAGGYKFFSGEGEFIANLLNP